MTDPLVYAGLDSFRSSLARVMGRLEDAARLVARATMIYQGLAEVELAAKCGIKLGCIHYRAGEYREGLQALDRAPGVHRTVSGTRRLGGTYLSTTVMFGLSLGFVAESGRCSPQTSPH